MPTTMVMLTTQDVAALLQVTIRRAEQLAESGKLPAIKIGNKWFFPKAEFDRTYQQRQLFVTPKKPPTTAA